VRLDDALPARVYQPTGIRTFYVWHRWAFCRSLADAAVSATDNVMFLMGSDFRECVVV
jgi:hypothetical protein